MNNIKHFEAFNSKETSAVSKFLKGLEAEKYKDFLDFISDVSDTIDRPLSKFNGQYLSAKKAKKLEAKDNSRFGYLKIFFTLKDGIVSKTITSRDLDYSKSYIDEFLNNNGYLSKNDLNSTYLSRLKGKLKNIKNVNSLKNEDIVVFKINGNLRSGQIYKEELEDKKTQTYVMVSALPSNDIPYMISPNESDKMLRKYGYSSFIKIAIDDKSMKYSYISLVEKDDDADGLSQELDQTISDTVKFMTHNYRTNSDLDRYRWDDKNRQIVDKADFALVLDIDEIIDTGESLSKIKNSRSSNKPLPRIDDEYFKKLNISKYRSAKAKNSKTEFIDDIKYMILDALDRAMFKMSRMMRDSRDIFGLEYLSSLYYSFRASEITTDELFNYIAKFDRRLYDEILDAIYNRNYYDYNKGIKYYDRKW